MKKRGSVQRISNHNVFDALTIPLEKVTIRGVPSLLG